MKIANIIEEGRLGGPQIRMVTVAASLPESAHTIIVMPSSESQAFQDMCSSHAVSYVSIPLTRMTRNWWGILKFIIKFPVELYRLRELLSELAPDVVHASGGSWQYKPVLAAYLAGIPVIWHLNDTYMPRIIRLIFRALSRLSNGFIFASERSREYYGNLALGGKPATVVPAPVDPEFFFRNCGCGQDDELLTLYADSLVVGMVANINPIKGVEDFIQTALLVQAREENSCFIVVGPVFETQRQYFNKLERLLADYGVHNVHFIGGKKDVRPYLKRFDVYVCSSIAESSPVSVWEAMAMEKAVVSTNVGDVPVHIKDGESGYIVPVGDTEAMADRILHLYRNPELRERMGMAARGEVKRSLSPEIVAEKTLSFYRQVVDASR